MSITILNVSGMKCAGCVTNVEKALSVLEGVDTVEVSLEKKTARVTGSAEADLLARAVTDAGYPTEVAD